jgi:hypothetical protein
VVWPNEGRLLATTESPATTIVGELPAAIAGGQTVAAAMSATAAGPVRRQMDRRRGERAD